MRKTRLLLGIALIVAGTAVGVLGVRSVLGDQTRVQAALLRGATGEADARGAPEKKSAEKEVWEAARLEPLEAALRARVDGPTLVDLFENEDWWRPYRSEFPLVRVRVGEKTTVSRGPEVGQSDEEVVAEARKRQISSAIVDVGGQSYVLAAAHLPGSPEIEAVLLLGRPVTLAPAAPAAAPGAARTTLRRIIRGYGCSRSASRSGARRWWSRGGGAREGVRGGRSGRDPPRADVEVRDAGPTARAPPRFRARHVARDSPWSHHRRQGGQHSQPAGRRGQSGGRAAADRAGRRRRHLRALPAGRPPGRGGHVGAVRRRGRRRRGVHPQLRPQAPAPRAGARQGGRLTVHRRGADAGGIGPLEHRPGVRLRRGGGRILHDPGVHRGPRPGPLRRPLHRAA